MIGQRLLPYEIVEKLGEGGIGVVCPARDARLDHTIALKVLPSHIGKREDIGVGTI